MRTARAESGRAVATVATAPEIEIYSASYCSDCAVAKAYMKSHHIAYTDYDVEGDIEKRKEFYARGGKGVPLIFVRGQRMEGFDQREFERLLRSAAKGG